MTTIIEDQDFLITLNESLLLVHRIRRPSISSESHICVGEAIWREDGFWEIRVVAKHPKTNEMGQKLVAITDSPEIALEVLWEQRNNVYWGYLQ